MNDSTDFYLKYQLTPEELLENGGQYTRRCTCCQTRKALISFRTRKVFEIGLSVVCNDCYAREHHGYVYRNLTERHRKMGLVYFVLTPEVNRIKVGITHKEDVYKRLKLISTDCPCDLHLLVAIHGTIIDEEDFHHQLHQYNHHGEWFEYSHEIQAIVKELKPFSAV